MLISIPLFCLVEQGDFYMIGISEIPFELSPLGLMHIQYSM
jgi:hypothetical protein